MLVIQVTRRIHGEHGNGEGQGNEGEADSALEVSHVHPLHDILSVAI